VAERSAPVKSGDRLLLHPSITGFTELAQGEVETVEHVEDPTSIPWSAGPAYPYRIHFRVDTVTAGGNASPRYATLWLNDDGHDPVGGVRDIYRDAG